MTVRELHDILMPKIDKIEERYDKHVENHNADVKNLHKLVYMMIGGIILAGVVLGTISFEIMI